MVSPHAEPPTHAFQATRWVVLPLLLAGEFWALVEQIEAPRLDGAGGILAAWVVNAREIWRAAIGMMVMTVIIAAPRLGPIAEAFRQAANRHRAPWALAAHAAGFVGFLFVSRTVMAKVAESGELPIALFVAWGTLGACLIGGWLLALAPWPFWRTVWVAEWRAVVVGACIGVPAGIFLISGGGGGEIQIGMWSWLAKPTFGLVHAILALVYPGMIYQPEEFTIGTAFFLARISYPCSGYEGMFLISVFLGAYFWLFRTELRFPQAFLLLPVGIGAMYIANAARIAALILVGSFISREVAEEGFHSQAGWINLTVVAFLIVFVSRRLRIFKRLAATAQASIDRTPDLASALLVPFLALMAVSMLIAAFSSDVQWLYPLKVLVLAPVLFYYRQSYRALGWKLSWAGPLIGVLVFALWMALEPAVNHAETPLARGLAHLAQPFLGLWLSIRVIGSILIIPMVEELAFRGYLLRKLSRSSFETVAAAQFTPLAIGVSSLAFGLAHGRWLAGTLAGLAFAAAYHRRGQLGDAVMAHVVANGLIAVAVLAFEQWGLW